MCRSCYCRAVADLYIWKSGEPRPTTPTVSGLTSSIFALLTALDPNTTYLWQVVSINGSGDSESEQWSFTTGTQNFLPGDINGDGLVNLTDAIHGFQILSGMQPAITVNNGADVNGDGKIGLEEWIYVLQVVAGLR